MGLSILQIALLQTVVMIITSQTERLFTVETMMMMEKTDKPLLPEAGPVILLTLPVRITVLKLEVTWSEPGLIILEVVFILMILPELPAQAHGILGHLSI